MKILFLTHYFYPHIGGVEKHVYNISQFLKSKNQITVITEKYNNGLRDQEGVGGIEVYRVSYPNKKYIGLFNIWLWLWKNRKLIIDSDIIHCHDVFIWYIPFRFLFPFKRVATTFHGWEGIYPIPLINIIQKKLANFLSFKTIAVGKYIEKYYGIKTNKIIYGGTNNIEKPKNKVKNYLVYLGRLEKDTGLLEFLNWLESNKKYQVDFIGDGSFYEECLKQGRVLGFVDPNPFLEKAEICVPGGYLSYIEAISFKCKILTFPNNKLKVDYWDEIKKIKKFPTWEKIANEYISLYNSKK